MTAIEFSIFKPTEMLKHSRLRKTKRNSKVKLLEASTYLA